MDSRNGLTPGCQAVRKRVLCVFASRREDVLSTVLITFLITLAVAYAEPAKEPLRILQSNPRYFTDNTGKAIYLAGTHNWNNFQNTGHRAGPGDPPPVLDYKRFLDFLESHHHNFFRLWRWEAPMWHDDEPIGIAHSTPHPWMRTGPGVAADEKPRFDLTRFNAEYFDRMRHHIEAAKAHGMYVSVMLFEGWEMQFVDAWTYHPYNASNNVNQIDADTN